MIKGKKAGIMTEKQMKVINFTLKNRKIGVISTNQLANLNIKVSNKFFIT